MRIDIPLKTNKIKAKSSSSSKSAGAGAVFKPNMKNNGASGAASTNSNNPIAMVGGILALQEVDDPVFARRKAFVRGQTMLEILEDMKTDLLAGQMNESHLNKLLAIVQQAKTKSDPSLDAIIEDIELRARVELAKKGHFL